MESATTVPAAPAPITPYTRYLRAFGEEQHAQAMLRLGIGSSQALAAARERRRIAEDELEKARVA